MAETPQRPAQAEGRNQQPPNKPAPPEGFPNDGNLGQQPAHQPVYQTDNTPQRQGQPGQVELGKPNEPGKPNFPNETGYMPPGDPRQEEHPTTADPNANNNADITGAQGAERQGDQKK